ncbi:hypothetical protein G9A89_012456 [Geosiphon pyriformis]|nr:hypothetical protein G9A89_012456 [Geosiphon pyriformis]
MMSLAAKLPLLKTPTLPVSVVEYTLEKANYTIGGMDIIFALKKLKRVPEDDKTEIEEFIKEELTSGRSPFKNTKKWTLMFQIANGIRETPIEKTLTEYIALYKKCWNELLNKRPSINEMNEKLKRIQWNSEHALSSQTGYVELTPQLTSETTLVRSMGLANTSIMALLQDIFTIINEVLNIYTYEDISKIIPRVEKHLTNTGQSSTDLFESAWFFLPIWN